MHHHDVARRRFRSALVLNPDRLGSQQLGSRDVALITATIVVIPAQADNAGGIVT